MKRTKDEWSARLSRQLQAFAEIARELGPEHAITKMIGGLAWGRHDWEWGPSGGGVQDVIQAVGALDGVYQTINTWARDNDYGAQRKIIKIYVERVRYS